MLVDGASGILAGHGRLRAAVFLGMDEVPVIELGGLSDQDKRAYMLADNQLALNAGWDVDVLKSELAALSSEGFDFGSLGNIDFKALETGAPATLNWKAPVVKFNMTFDDDEQQQAWFEFVRRLQQEYPNEATLAARLVLFLKGLPEPKLGEAA